MIYGAGQAGEMAASWLPGGYELQAFVDGNELKKGSTILGVPVLSPKEAFGASDRHPDLLYLCVINREAAEEIRRTIVSYGFRGMIVEVPALRGIMDIRLSFLRLISREIRENGTEGDLAELGVYRGDFARELNALFPDRDLLLFDTFEGFDEKDLRIEKEKAADGRNARAERGDFGDTSIEIVRNNLPHPEKAFFIKGRFPESLSLCPQHRAEDRNYCLVSLDTDLYEPTLEGLRFFCTRLSHGGVILIHDYNSSQYPGVKRAVRTFAAETAIRVMPLMDLHGTAVVFL